MKTINKMMVAIDFSDYSLLLVRYASGLAGDVGAEILLVNIINQRDVDMMHKVADEYPAFSVKKHLDEIKQDREDRLQELVAKSDCDIRHVSTMVRTGLPYKSLLDVIEETKPDLLVMATKGRSNIVDTIIGSCAQKLFRHSPVPILSIRGGEKR